MPTPASDDFRPIRVQVSVLCGHERHHWIAPELDQGLLAWAADPRVTHPDGQFMYAPLYDFRTSQEARNRAFSLFLEPDNKSEYLLMIDNDTVPVLAATGELLNLLELPNCNLPIVAAAVPTIQYVYGKGAPQGGRAIWGINAYTMQGGDDPGYRMLDNEELGSGLVECVSPHRLPAVPVRQVDVVGFGAVCIRRDVARMMTQYQWTYTEPGAAKTPIEVPPPIPPVLRSRALDGSTTFGEDLLFCRRAADLGIPSYCAPTLLCDHNHTLYMGRIPHTQMAVRPELAEERNKKQRMARAQSDYVLYGIGELLNFDQQPLDITPWSMQASVAMHIRQLIIRGGVTSVLELGPGVSTLVIHKALSETGTPDEPAKCISLEHYTGHLSKVLGALPELSHVTHQFLEAPLGLTGFYDQEANKLIAHNAPYQLLVIDGPPGHYHSRWQAQTYFQYLTPTALVIMDDVHRHEEREVTDKWIRDGQLVHVEFIGRARVMRRPNYKDKE